MMVGLRETYHEYEWGMLMRTASDTVLLQLQALFGPMLTSALHLVDKRDGKYTALAQEHS